MKWTRVINETYGEETDCKVISTISEPDSVVTYNTWYSNTSRNFNSNTYYKNKQKKSYEEKKKSQLHNKNKKQNSNNLLSLLTSALNDIAERLSKLEMREKKDKGVSCS